MRCSCVSIAGELNVGSQDEFKKISWCEKTFILGCAVFNQFGTWPEVTRNTFRIQGAYLNKDRKEYFNSWLSRYLLDEPTDGSDPFEASTVKFAPSALELREALYRDGPGKMLLSFHFALESERDGLCPLYL